MTDEPRAIDVSSLAELVRIKHDEDLLRERLEKMEATKEKVSEVVYRRVRGDYERRKAALEAEARAPRERAGREYAKLRVLKGEAEKSLEEARLQNEELEFRHDLGEFPEEEFRTRLGECQTRLDERQRELDELIGLKAEFLKAFQSEEDLERAASGPAPAPSRPLAPTPSAVPRPIAGGGTVSAPIQAQETPKPVSPFRTTSAPLPPPPAPVPVGRTGSAPLSAPPPPSPDATVIGAPPPMVTSPGEVPSATLMMALARVVVLVDDKPEREYILKPEPMSIGRSPESTIHLPYPDVSRQHAAILPEGAKGFKVVDRGSPNGVFVNGERVKEHLLTDGDVIQVGRRKLVYRT